MESRDTMTPTEIHQEAAGKKVYGVEGKNISVAWKTYSPEIPSQTETDAKKAVLFIPGWSIPENAESLQRMGQAFSDYSKNKTFIADTTTENTSESNLVDEAKALALFLKEQGITNVTLVGNSQGGAEAIHLVAILHEQFPDIHIDGLALFDPVTLVQQSPIRLLSSYTKDIVKTGIALAHAPRMGSNEHVQSQNAKYVKDGITGILKALIHSNRGWPAKILNEVTEMSQENPDLAKVNVPVILFQGAHDKISNPAETIPGQYFDTKDYTEDPAERERLLGNIFPNSPHVEMVVPEKMGYHNVSYSRPESFARASLYLLKRFYRPEPKNTATDIPQSSDI